MPMTLKTFIDVFLRQSEESIALLTRSCVDGTNQNWVEASHKLKGGAGMVGAKRLRAFCERAQNMQSATSRERKLLLNDIVEEYGEVRKLLMQYKSNKS